jgi:hypothetical protein
MVRVSRAFVIVLLVIGGSSLLKWAASHVNASDMPVHGVIPNSNCEQAHVATCGQCLQGYRLDQTCDSDPPNPLFPGYRCFSFRCEQQAIGQRYCVSASSGDCTKAGYIDDPSVTCNNCAYYDGGCWKYSQRTCDANNCNGNPTGQYSSVALGSSCQ